MTSCCVKSKKCCQKTFKQNISELFKRNNKFPPRLNCETSYDSTFYMLESMLFVRDLLGQIALANNLSFVRR